MTARDRWTEKLRCPVCGIQGEASLSQEDGWSFRHDQSTRVDACPEGFRYQAHEADANLVRFFCIKDDVPADK